MSGSKDIRIAELEAELVEANRALAASSAHTTRITRTVEKLEADNHRLGGILDEAVNKIRELEDQLKEAKG